MPIKRVDIDASSVLKGKEIPRPDHIVLPGEKYGARIVSWEEVAHDIKHYACFIHKNKIYSKRVTKGKGDEPDEEWFKEVSNFSIVIHQHMRDQKVAMRLVEITNVWGVSHVFETPTLTFSSIALFKQVVESFGNFHFTGNQTDLDHLKSKLMDEMGNGKMITVLGWNPSAKLFVMNNAAVNGSVIQYDENGVFEHGGTMYYVPSANSIYADSDAQFESQKRVLLVQNGIDFKQFSQQLYRVHREHGAIGLVYLLAVIFSDHIYKDRNFFPVLYLYGHPSSGKGQLIRGLQTVFGRALSSMTITGAANTDKAKIREFAQFRNMLVALEEYSIAVPDATNKMIQGIWDRYGYKRGTLDSAYSVETVPITCGAIVTGNDYPMVDALVTRLVITEMMVTDFSPEQKGDYEVMNEMIAKGYSGILTEILSHRSAFEAEWIAHWAEARKDVNDLELSAPGIAARMLDNAAVLLAVHRFFGTRLQWPFTYNYLLKVMKEAMIKQNTKRDNSGSVMHFWECFRKAVKNEQLILGEDFKVNGNSLIIFWSAVHSEYLELHRKLYGKEGDSQAVMVDKLTKSPAFVKKRDRDVRSASGAKMYGYEFRCDALGDLVEDVTRDRKRGRKNSKQEQAADELAEML